MNLSDENQNDELEVFGYPGSVFYAIHITAVTSLCLSIVASGGVGTYFFLQSHEKNVWRRPIGERLVLYLAVADLMHSVSHLLDHGYMMAVIDHPPDTLCTAFASVLIYAIAVQMMIVLFTAVNLCVLVVKEKKLKLGKYDWRLMVLALGVPAAVTGMGLVLHFWGPGGAWCFVDMRKPTGCYVTIAFGVCVVLTVLTCIVCYVMVWFKVRRISQRAGSWLSQQRKYSKMARVMTLFVLAYVGQWWCAFFLSIWWVFRTPPVSTIGVAVGFINMGGVFNCLAYTVIRRKYSGHGRDIRKEKDFHSSNKSFTVTEQIDELSEKEERRKKTLIQKVHCLRSVESF